MTNKSIKYSHFELGIRPDILMVFYYVGFSHNLNVIHTVHFYFKMDKHRWSNKKFNQVNALLYSCTLYSCTVQLQALQRYFETMLSTGRTNKNTFSGGFGLLFMNLFANQTEENTLFKGRFSSFMCKSIPVGILWQFAITFC